jgi:hypothetical protein
MKIIIIIFTIFLSGCLTQPDKQTTNPVPFAFSDGQDKYLYSHIVVPVKMQHNNIERVYSLILDTGAPFTFLTKEAAAAYKLPQHNNNSSAVDAVASVTNSSVKNINQYRTDVAFFDNVEVVGSGKRTKMYVSYSHDLPQAQFGQKIDGVLGLDYLSRYKLSLDFQNRQLFLK